MNKGLVIRYFSGGFYLCDGLPPEGCENDGDLYIGNPIKWFETWNEANNLRTIINNAFGHDDNWETSECAV